MDINTESLWQEFQHRLRAFIRRRVVDDQTANDVLQQAFLQMHKSIRDGMAPDQPRAWVFASTRNAIADHYRRERSQSAREVAAAAMSQAGMSQAGVALADASSARSGGHSAAERTDAIEIEQCIEPLLLGLAAPYREAIRMTTLQGMTQGAAARQAGISLSGMKSRLQRGRGKLRILLEAYCAAELEASGRPIQSAPTTNCLCETDKKAQPRT